MADDLVQSVRAYLAEHDPDVLAAVDDVDRSLIQSELRQSPISMTVSKQLSVRIHEAVPVLDSVAFVLTQLPQRKKLAIEGHTDNKGPADHSTVLCERRARSVQMYLI